VPSWEGAIHQIIDLMMAPVGEVTKLTDIVNVIIPHFNEYPLVTSKQLNFLASTHLRWVAYTF
jgi:hypothetical protein